MKRFVYLSVVALAIAGAVEADAQELREDLSLIFRMGELEGAPEFVFGGVTDLAFGPEATIYVLDRTNSVVRRYDHSGRHLNSFGRAGDGPGEMRSPAQLIITDDHVLVFDNGLRRTLVFDLTGEHLETRRWDEMEGSFDVMIPLRSGHSLAGMMMSVRIGGRLLELSRQGATEIRRQRSTVREITQHVVAVVGPDQTAVDTIFKYDHGLVLYFSSTGVGVLGSMGPGGGWAVSGDSLVALVDGMRGEVQVFEVGEGGIRPLWEERVPVAAEPLSEREWRELESAVREDRNLPVPIELVGPPFRPKIAHPFLDQDGALWVRRLDRMLGSAPDASQAVHLVIPGPVLPVWGVRMPPGFDLVAVRGDLLLGRRLSQVGVPQVEMWSLAR